MIDTIPFDTALQTLTFAYLVSGILLMTVSYIGWAVIEMIEESSDLSL